MNNESVKIQVSDFSGREGVYHLYELFEGDKINVTAQGLLDIAAWVEEHRAKLEQETDAEKEQDRKFWEQETQEQTQIKQEWITYQLEGDKTPPRTFHTPVVSFDEDDESEVEK